MSKVIRKKALKSSDIIASTSHSYKVGSCEDDGYFADTSLLSPEKNKNKKHGQFEYYVGLIYITKLITKKVVFKSFTKNKMFCFSI